MPKITEDDILHGGDGGLMYHLLAIPPDLNPVPCPECNSADNLVLRIPRDGLVAVTCLTCNRRGEYALDDAGAVAIWKNAERDFALKDFGPAPSAPQPTEPVAVKPLEWEEINPSVFRAFSAFGSYYWAETGRWSYGDGRWNPAADPRAAAQADYNARILSALASPVAQQRDGVVEEALRQAQDVLAEYIVPDSGISDRECINRLLGILDHQDLVRNQRALSPIAQQRDEGWQDIATAPKDGTNILLYTPGLREYASRVVGHWGKPLIGASGWFNYDGTKKLLFDPTHWRPLPQPPVLSPSARTSQMGEPVTSPSASHGSPSRSPGEGSTGR